MSKNTGGPAFPSHGSMGEVISEGMTLRDYFAAKAIQKTEPPKDYIGTTETKQSYTSWAEKCWRMADAMIEARGESVMSPSRTPRACAHLPTFDEWFMEKHGISFEQLYMHPFGKIDVAMLELSRSIREYVSEISVVNT